MSASAEAPIHAGEPHGGEPHGGGPHASGPRGGDPHGHAPPPPGQPYGDQAGHGSLRGYLTGFGLSVVLTALPFWLVMERPAGAVLTAALVLAFAAVQIVVHVIFFLHLNTKSQGGWNLLALIFTVVLVGIAVGGSIWVMYHLNANMMPGAVVDQPTQFMRNMP